MVPLLFFLIGVDSLPPIPDLSQILFPEPHLWFQPAKRHLELSVYGGHYFGGNCDLFFDNLDLFLQYEMCEDWDSLLTATGQASYNITLPHLFLKPSIDGFFHKRNDEYRFLAPELDAIIQLPWSFFSTAVNAELWQINTINYQEYTASADVIFDRVIYMPHFSISGIYSGKKLEPTITGKLHMSRVHLSIGSLLSRSFPSPIFHIQYLEPTVKIGAKFMNGALSQTLKQRFDPSLPLQYRISIPTESLKTSITLDCSLDFHNQIIAWSASYNGWYEKITPGEGFIISSKKDVEELNFCVAIRNSITSQDMHLNNSLNIIYTWLDSAIAFIPRHAVYDTLIIAMGPLEITASAVQYTRRHGVTHILPALFMINPKLGYYYKGFMVFFNVNNATDEKEEIFDGYFLNGRQYVAGLSFDYSF
ncbi:MAG: hypothetical protein WBB37_04475 [bacterium]